MTRIHASLKGGRSRAAVRAYIRAAIKQWQPTALTFTEAAGFRGLFEADGYRSIQPKGKGELAAMVRDDVTSSILPLSSKGIPRRGGQTPYALVLHGDETTIVVHLPSGVEGVRGLRSGAQAAVWRDCIETLAEYVRTVSGPVCIVGDWNVNAKRAWVRELLEREFPDFRIVHSAKGTHRGGRAIDFMLTRDLPAETAEAVKNPVSDHKAVLFRSKENPVTNIVTRDQWGARPRGATRSSHPIGSTKGITAHWEGPHMGDFPHSACAGKVRGIEAFHRDSRGWADIAYNALVCPHGYVFEGRGPGVTSAANGNSVTNGDWYAVCYLGGEGDPFTVEGQVGFLDAFDWLTREGGAGPARNGHRDHKATACPGGEIYAWVRSGAVRPTPPKPDPKPAPAKRSRVQNARAGLTKWAAVLMKAARASRPGRAAALRAEVRKIRAARNRLPKK